VEKDPRVASISPDVRVIVKSDFKPALYHALLPNAHDVVRSDMESACSTTSFDLTGLRTPTSPACQASRAPTVIPRNGAISKPDLIKSPEDIVFRYLAPSLPLGKESHEMFLVPTEDQQFAHRQGREC
jgi:hypothetical protein